MFAAEKFMSMPVISSFWMGPRLSFLDQLCLKSFADMGHRVKLYAYEEIENLPKGVSLEDASTIMALPDFGAGRVVHPAKVADIFRYQMLAQTDEIWVDTDAYCCRAFPDVPYLFACHHKDILSNGVLRLPRDSAALKALIEFTDREWLTIPRELYAGRLKPEIATRDRENEHGQIHIADIPYDALGPFALTYFLNNSGEARLALPRVQLYPVAGTDKRVFLRSPAFVNRLIPEGCLSIHFYGSAFRTLLRRRTGGLPPPGSFIEYLCQKHEIDATAAP